MKTTELQASHNQELKRLFLKVFSSDPWFDKWEDTQLDLYLHDLTGNSNSLSFVLRNDQNDIIGGALGYVFNWWEGQEFYIKEFFISNDLQSKGIGSLFLDQIDALLKPQAIRHITLNTERTFPAYHFYKKNGFTELSDSVFMAKKVDE